MKTTILSTLALLTPLSLATSITVLNGCPFPISIKPDAQAFDGAISTIPIDGQWVDTIHTERLGNSIKMSRSNTDFTAPISFDYTVANGQIYYDVSDMAGAPFPVYAVNERDNDAGECPSVGCPGGPGECRFIKACTSDTSFTVIAC